MTEDDDTGLTTTKTSLKIITTLKDMDGGRVTEIAERLDMPPSTVHSHLTTLKKTEYVVKEGDEYYLGLRFLDLGEYVRNRSDSYIFAKEKVNQLAEDTGGRAHFVVEEHGRGVYLYTSTGEHAVKAYSSVGKRVYLHVAAAGKSILAFMPQRRVDEVIDRWGLPKETENTITDRETLYEELERVREQGYAFNREEHLNGINAVGAPVLADNDQVIGAFSVSGPAHRMKGESFEKDVTNTVLSISNELELKITYS